MGEHHLPKEEAAPRRTIERVTVYDHAGKVLFDATDPTKIVGFESEPGRLAVTVLAGEAAHASQDAILMFVGFPFTARMSAPSRVLVPT